MAPTVSIAQTVTYRHLSAYMRTVRPVIFAAFVKSVMRGLEVSS